MPIINADEAENIVFLKRSMRPGFAGIDNDLLFDDKTTLLFGDAKDTLTKLVAAVKERLGRSRPASRPRSGPDRLAGRHQGSRRGTVRAGASGEIAHGAAAMPCSR